MTSRRRMIWTRVAIVMALMISLSSLSGVQGRGGGQVVELSTIPSNAVIQAIGVAKVGEAPTPIPRAVSGRA